MEARMIETMPKTLSDLPKDIEDMMRQERAQLSQTWFKDDSYHIMRVNKEGTRFFSATRANDFAGYGSTGSHWNVRYGKVVWKMRKNPMTEFSGHSYDDYTYEWCTGVTFSKSANGTEIPQRVATKKEVMEILDAIDIFD